ncbi:hypothetical protein L2E82_40125 [Cichorium intybus]|uniref:Uncharacterized protein n=1 Tax=Cichorium intybus TaxID=13427 RepID=A0ACB9AJG6_CICIN|nr:hypothetical protein L2E82_40125 [Cichorium intybus]
MTRPQASRLSEHIPTRQASTTALPLMSRFPRLPVSCLAGTQELYQSSMFLSYHGLKPPTTSLTPEYVEDVEDVSDGVGVIEKVSAAAIWKNTGRRKFKDRCQESRTSFGISNSKLQEVVLQTWLSTEKGKEYEKHRDL